jgi:hypothetical protein
MASAELNRRVEKVVGYPPLSEMGDDQRRESRRRFSLPGDALSTMVSW